MKFKALKRCLIMFLCFFVGVTTITAQVRTAASALQSVRDFGATRLLSAPTTARRVAPQGEYSLVYTQKDLTSDNPAYYVFNCANQSGFVIVSGDVKAEPILAYIDSGAFVPADIPAAMQDLLDQYAAEMDQLSGMTEKEYRSHAQKSVTSARTSSNLALYVSPLLGYMQWNQSAPYNLMCPMDGGYRSVTGCAATAMAQIMRYHQWPVSGRDTASYVSSTNQFLIVDTIANSTYDWAHMPLQYDANSSTQEQNAVARLMYDCGASIQMDYSASSSGANSSKVVAALVKYFDYDVDVVKLDKSQYSYWEWVSIIKSELTAHRPVYHTGCSIGGCHAFVCDGYDANDYFHFNWGWGGSGNGYFRLTALSPSTGGIGAGTADGYNISKSIIVGIQRPNALTERYRDCPFILQSQPKIDTTWVTRQGQSTIYLTKLYNKMAQPFTGLVGFALYNENMQQMSQPVSYQVNDLQTGWGYSMFDLDFTIPASLANGNYRFYPVYVSSAEDTTLSQWKIIRGAANVANYVNVRVTTDTVYFSAEIQFAPQLELSYLRQNSSLYSNRLGEINLQIKNRGVEYSSALDVQLANASDTMVFRAPALTIMSGDSVQLNLQQTVSVLPGSYTLRVLYDDTNLNEEHAQTPLGNAFAVTVKPEPTVAPDLMLARRVAFDDDANVMQHGAVLTVALHNSGSYFSGKIYPFVYSAQGQYLSYLSPIMALVDSGVTRVYSIPMAVDFPAGNYILQVQYKPTNGSMTGFDYDSSTINFIVVNTYALMFDVNGGMLENRVRYFKTGDSFSNLPVPVRDGYVFAGWYVGSTLIDNSMAWSYVNDTIAQARWNAQTYQILLDVNGGSCSETSIVAVSGECLFNLPTPTRMGYSFQGWYLGSQLVDNNTVWSYGNNATLQAHWAAQSFTLWFDANGGVAPVASATVTYDSAIGSLPVPTRDDYQFDGWYVDSELLLTSTVWQYIEDKSAQAHWSMLPTGVDEAGVEVVAYPNPMLEVLYVKSTQPITSLTLRNALGKVVLTICPLENPAQLSVQTLDEGVYFLSVVTADGKGVVLKLIK